MGWPRRATPTKKTAFSSSRGGFVGVALRGHPMVDFLCKAGLLKRNGPVRNLSHRPSGLRNIPLGPEDFYPESSLSLLGMSIARIGLADYQPEHEMPSAQPQETGEPFLVTTDRQRADLHSLLHAIGVSNAGHLTSMHGREKVLFAEGEPARGVFILRTGRATVSMSSSEGRVVILRTAQPGDVLGLNSVLRNGFYDLTLKTLEPCHTDFISRAHLIELMEKSHAGAHAVLNLLSRELTELTDRAKSLLLSQTAGARMARLLLEWCKKVDFDSSGVARIDKVFTHEQLAQMICSSRETVTRLLASLSRRNIIEITSDSVLIRDYAALERMAQS